MGLLQVAFMQGLPGIFKVRPQNWVEWVVAVAIGAGSLPLAFITKLISRYVENQRCDASASTLRTLSSGLMCAGEEAGDSGGAMP